MDYELIYWRHPTIPGIKVEEVSGGDHYKGNIWKEMARQIYCENGKDAYRDIGHFRNGAPFLFGESSRISISHCQGLYVVATLPPTPEVQLDIYSPRAALGVDAERADRYQAMRLRERFLSDAELAMVPPHDVEANVLAWTIKEAAYKAALQVGVDFRKQIAIEKLPRLAPAVTVFDPKEFGLPSGAKSLTPEFFGKARVLLTEPGTDSKTIELDLYSYRSDDCIVTLAYSPQCAKFGKASV